MNYKIVTAKYLKECALWKGSLEEFAFLHEKGISMDLLNRRIDMYACCDDMTPAEIEYRDACLRTKNDPLGIG